MFAHKIYNNNFRWLGTFCDLFSRNKQVCMLKIELIYFASCLCLAIIFHLRNLNQSIFITFVSKSVRLHFERSKTSFSEKRLVLVYFYIPQSTFFRGDFGNIGKIWQRRTFRHWRKSWKGSGECFHLTSREQQWDRRGFRWRRRRLLIKFAWEALTFQCNLVTWKTWGLWNSW